MTRAGLVLATALLLAACGAAEPGAGGSGEPTDTTLTVFAAASLREPFTDLAAGFEQEHPGAQVQLSFAGSSDLVTQITEGAPADVFAAADEATMQRLVDAGLAASDPVPFATNTLTLVTPPGNPAGVSGLADLADPDVALVACAPQVPCGAAAQRVAQRGGVTLAPRSEEPSVADVLAKVVAGEADAGLVYVTDAWAAGDDVEEVALPEAGAAVNTYPVAVVEGGEQPTLAQEFVALVTGEPGREVLAEAGFGLP